MKKAAEINAAIEPLFARYGDALKVAGAGNGAGLFGVIAAIGTIHDGHPYTEILLKPLAIIFALGVFLFAAAYLFLTYAFIYGQHYTSILEQAERARTMLRNSGSQMEASITYMHRSILCGLVCAFVFFVGLVVSCISLIRY